jgi:hypothetical protein
MSLKLDIPTENRCSKKEGNSISTVKNRVKSMIPPWRKKSYKKKPLSLTNREKTLY